MISHLVSIAMANLGPSSSLYVQETIRYFPPGQFMHEVLCLVGSGQQLLSCSLEPLVTGRLGSWSVSKPIGALLPAKIVQETFLAVGSRYWRLLMHNFACNRRR